MVQQFGFTVSISCYIYANQLTYWENSGSNENLRQLLRLLPLLTVEAAVIQMTMIRVVQNYDRMIKGIVMPFFLDDFL